jgi:N-acetylglutamate synthase/N-acetylornithine aminotransferase
MPSEYVMSSVENLFSYLEHDKITQLIESIVNDDKTPDRITNIIQNGTKYRLAMFPDGAGKIRYIAIGP